MKSSYIWGSARRRLYSDGSIILPKHMYSFFEEKTLNPTYTNVKENDFNFLELAENKKIPEEYKEGELNILSNRRIILEEKAKNFINNPKYVVLLWVIDRLEIWNSVEFGAYENRYKDFPLEKMVNDLSSEEIEILSHF